MEPHPAEVSASPSDGAVSPIVSADAPPRPFIFVVIGIKISPQIKKSLKSIS
jgi:hypothetical protein